jgi:hypothetical protein
MALFHPMRTDSFADVRVKAYRVASDTIDAACIGFGSRKMNFEPIFSR